ncbi:AraC family transcriptional regulator [Hymenobacter nivis]|uniref:AraC family transcriptional regulator n=1 Tax=Hymenobacter nivis TaxID=1850093 RepID=A0A502HDR1_9BACT|nr:AraC family transcriptional regulator [Hymenobacter nivis]
MLLPAVATGALATGWLLLRALQRRTLADVLLAMLLAVPTLNIAQQMLGYAGWYDRHDGYTTAMLYGPWQLNLLLGPAYYLYFRSLTNQEFRLGPRAWWHLLPGLLQLGLVAGALSYDLLWLTGIRGQPLPNQAATIGPALGATEVFGHYLGYAQYVLLPAYCWRVLADYQRYNHYLQDNFSDTERLRFAGLRQLLLVQVLALVLSQFFTLASWKFGLSDAVSWYYFFLRGFLIYWLVAVGLQANYAAATTPLRFDTAPDLPVIPEPAGELHPAPAADAPGPQAQPAAGLPAPPLAPELLAWRGKLLALMAEEQPWLEPELTLTEVAKRLRITPGLLSKVINTGCGQNFNDFVNAYRVQEAQRLLADPRFAHYSLVGVALESGFNSRSTFNRVFKKVTGQVPSELSRPKI